MSTDLSLLSALVVEDDPVFAALCETMLADAGAGQVAVALNERQFESCLREGMPVNLVLLDLNMPRLDGLAAMRKLAVAGYTGQIGLISGSDPAVLESSARLAGILNLRLTGTVAKPLRFNDLGKLLNKWRENELNAPAPSPASPGRTVNGATELVPVYQPKYAVDGSGAVGAEALMRIRGMDGRLESPAHALSAFTAAGKLGEATLDFLELVLLDLQSWGQALAGLPVSINVPAPLMETEGFMSEFAGRVQRRGVAPSRIVVEMTESAVPDDLASIVEVSTRLRMAGFGLSLDDYGTGMANYDILRLCPFTELKIDRSVIQSTTRDALACGFVGNCVAIARALDLKVVAEGVETKDQAEAVQRLGVDIIQGFYFSAPLPRPDFERLVRGAAAA
jgi:EAL domain-containing protein (putative c-di-GMP-specific phosphodiesterase class I)